ncbi:uncharacterized protein LOC116663317 isoform X1 [Camelus ferus]|uniref:Uncharacterized protein LOC116663317 isoform X1 n=1 Tax=Camelus ferus TaxID=419612 RepID=A0A8B8SXX7_CAMFR|nr:uncharacterized protein LOC116663317 isoform X1 [Camelus ferus]XP_032334768.1 uncharacterized protein LOC116663317 isoform X1 [Camelus ferus]
MPTSVLSTYHKPSHRILECQLETLSFALGQMGKLRPRKGRKGSDFPSITRSSPGLSGRTTLSCQGEGQEQDPADVLTWNLLIDRKKLCCPHPPRSPLSHPAGLLTGLGGAVPSLPLQPPPLQIQGKARTHVSACLQSTVSRTRRDLTPGFITPPLTVHRLVEDLTKRRRQKSPRRARTANTTNPGTLQCFHRRESCVLEKTSSAPPMLGGGSVSWEAGQPRGAALGGEAPHLTPSGCGLPVHPNPAPCTRGALISLTGWGALWEPGGAHESSPAVRVGSEDMHPEDPRHRPGFPEAGGALLAPPRHRAQGSPESPKVTVVRGKAEIQSEVCLIPKPRSLLWELPAPPSPGPQRWP